MTEIGNNIKKLRKVKGLSQQAFAELFELTRGNISSYEEHRAEPRISVILQIAKYFSIPVSELLESKLTVNEILNFADHFGEETVQADVKNLTAIPFLNREAMQQLKDTAIDIEVLPRLFLPVYTKYSILAVENHAFVSKPTEFPFEESAILFFEQVHVETLHTLDKHYGFYAKGDTIFFGQYKVSEKKIKLVLNDWMKVHYAEEDKLSFWKLCAKFEKVG